jgi:hypothetical protein
MRCGLGGRSSGNARGVVDRRGGVLLLGSRQRVKHACVTAIRNNPAVPFLVTMRLKFGQW